MSWKRDAQKPQRKKANKKALNEKRVADKKALKKPIRKTDSDGDWFVAGNFKPTGRDWISDAVMYERKCVKCDRLFHGGKDRGICGACAPAIFNDKAFGELETEFALHAAESGFDQGQSFESWLDEKYPTGWVVIE